MTTRLTPHFGNALAYGCTTDNEKWRVYFRYLQDMNERHEGMGSRPYMDRYNMVISTIIMIIIITPLGRIYDSCIVKMLFHLR